jgi:hypothetical protein
MGKTLNHYSQQIRSLAPDALVLDRARELGAVLIEAKAAVQAAGRKWTEWLETDCSLSSRTAQRFMTIARRWDEPAFIEARQARPGLALREADKVLAATSSRKRPEPEQPDPVGDAYRQTVDLLWELQKLIWDRQVDEVAGNQLQAAGDALGAARSALFVHTYGQKTAINSEELPPRRLLRRVELAVGDRCSCSRSTGDIQGTITEVHPEPGGNWSTYSWLQDGTDQPVMVGWGMPGALSGLRYSISGQG